MTEDRFLGRWSRRKQEARKEPQASEAGTAAAEAPAPAVPESLDEATAEEIAALPSVESVMDVAGLRPFLRRGIPAAMRQAALRRIWRLDPKIRDYVDAAQDYAFDWNAPGGVPGGGGIVTQEQVAGILDRLFAPKTPAEPTPQEDPQAVPVAVQEGAGDAAPDPVPEPISREGKAAPAARDVPRNRHGSATPS
jgi:hypothetical protein